MKTIASLRNLRLAGAVAAAALAFAAATPARAQLGYGPGADRGLEVKLRPLGARAFDAASTASPEGRASAGGVGSGKKYDGLVVKHSGVALEARVFAGEKWSEWKKAGVELGTPGKPIGGLALRAAKGTIRYRVAFADVGLSEWVEDGSPVGGSDAALAIEAIDVEYRATAPKDAKVEYRAFLRGSGWGPWVGEGQTAGGTGDTPELLAIQIRSGHDIRYEVSLFARGFLPTAKENQTAGDVSGENRVEGLRIFGGGVPVRYRVKLSKSGWLPWASDGSIAGMPGGYEKIEAFELRVYR